LSDENSKHGAAKGNRLAASTSPYLRSASHQPIDWYEWGDEAFARAREANKPILLVIGAVQLGAALSSSEGHIYGTVLPAPSTMPPPPPSQSSSPARDQGH